MKPSLNQYKKIKEFISDHRDKKCGFLKLLKIRISSDRRLYNDVHSQILLTLS